MDSPFAHHVSHFGSPNPAYYQGSSMIRSYPIEPIEIVPEIGHDIYSARGLYNPSPFVDPTLLHQAQQMHPMPGSFGSPHRTLAVDPSLLHYGGSPMPGNQVMVDPSLSRPDSGSSYDSGGVMIDGIPNGPVYSRRTEGGPVRTSDVGVGYSAGEPYFGRTPSTSLRQRTAQACERCRDRKTKCSGTRPVCNRCSDRNIPCVWAAETRVRGQSRNKLGGGRPSSGDFTGHPVPSLPHPLSASPVASSSSSQLEAEGIAEDVVGVATGKKSKRIPPALALGENSNLRPKQGRAAVKHAKNLAAQRKSWPMGPPVSSNAHSVKMPVSSLGSIDDDSWDSVWASCEPEVSAAPVPGRYIDYEALINGSLDYSSGSSRDSSPPQSASTTNTSFSDFSAIIPTAQDTELSAEMYDLLNLPVTPSSPSSSPDSDSPASGQLDFDNLAEFASAAKANGGDIANEVTPMPQVASAQDDHFMSQFLSPDFYGSF